MCNFGLKMVIFGPFKSLSLGGEKILIFQIWLKKSLVLPSWRKGVKLAWKTPFREVKWPNMRFWLENCHFWPLSASPPVSGENFDLSNLARKVSGIVLLVSGCKISIEKYHIGGQNGQMCDFCRFPYTFLYKTAENHRSRYLAPFLPVSMPVFWFSEPSRHPWK